MRIAAQSIEPVGVTCSLRDSGKDLLVELIRGETPSSAELFADVLYGKPFEQLAPADKARIEYTLKQLEAAAVEPTKESAETPKNE